MDELLSPSDSNAPPGLIAPTNINKPENSYPVPIYHLNISNYDEVSNMTINEVIKSLNGNIGLNNLTLTLIIGLFVLLILVFIPLMIGALLLYFKNENSSLGARKYTIIYAPEGGIDYIRPYTASSYILSVDYNNMQANNTIQSTIFIDGSIGSNHIMDGSVHTFTSVASFGDNPSSGAFSTVLTIRNDTSITERANVKFKLLGSDIFVSNFSVNNFVVDPRANITHTASRHFIWGSGNQLIEIDQTNSLID